MREIVDPPRDREEFWIRFICGALFGTMLGLFIFWDLFASDALKWILLPLAPVFFGLLAALWGRSVLVFSHSTVLVAMILVNPDMRKIRY